ncbi:MAG TPA: nucleotide disphospho-sugar-binding domain-containing protein [Candidatus Dormibacteraeota bacterium]
MRILFATTAADGHFNPLSGLAVHLRDAGHDVRWYTGLGYSRRLSEMGIEHYPFQRAREINGANLAELFPGRAKLKGPALIRFDFEHVFSSNMTPYFEDVRDIDRSFPFDVLVTEGAWTAARLVREVLGKQVMSIGPGGLLNISRDEPPNFMGCRPARTPAGRLFYRALNTAMDLMVFNHGRRLYNQVLAEHGVAPITGRLLAEAYAAPHASFANSVPGFELPGRHRPPSVRFAGLLPTHRSRAAEIPRELAQAGPDRRVVLVSQGTIDNVDPGKLIVPTVEALVDTGVLLVVATGHRNTESLRRRFPQENVAVHDYVDFGAVLERADVFVCNGGHGSVLLSLSRGVPLVVAGVREGKNDINARVEYCGAGVNLRTESPSPRRIAKATDRVLTEPSFKARAQALRDELASYRPLEIIDEYLEAEVEPRLRARGHTSRPGERQSGRVVAARGTG